MKQKLFAIITAILTTASLSGQPTASAETGDISLAIDQITLTPSELDALDHTVPVYINLTENVGFDAAEFGIAVDSRCSFSPTIDGLVYDTGYFANERRLTWRTLASDTNWYDIGSILRLDVQIPETAAAGDVYIINYVAEAHKPHLWTSLTDTEDLTDAVQYTDGFIRIVEETTSDTAFVPNRDGWSFTNSYRSFGAGTYQLQDVYYEKLMDGLSPKEQAKINALLSENWHGACYGMAAASILGWHGMFGARDYQTDASSLYEIAVPLSEDTKSLIYYYYAIQKTDAIQQMLANAITRQPEEEKLQMLIAGLEDDSPVLMTYLDYEWGGHAVVAYDIIPGIYHYGGRTYNNKVCLYDSNVPTMRDEYCLYFDTADWNWIIPAYELGSASRSFLGIVTDDLDIINYHGYFGSTSDLPQKSYIPVLSSAQIDTAYEITTGSDSGLHIGVQEGIKAYSSLNYADGSHDLCFALPGASDSCTFTLASPDALDLSMDYENSLLELSADAAVSATFTPSGSIRIVGEDSDYCMDFICNDTAAALRIEGQNAGYADMQRTADGYLLRSDALRQISVCMENGMDTDILGFSAEGDSILLKVTEYGMTALADADGDGSYETPIAESGALLAGDLTLDQMLSMTDVITLNRSLLNGESLNTAQLCNADHNQDGMTTAADALSILRKILLG